MWTIHKEESRLYHTSQTPFNAENTTLFQCMETFDKQPLCLIFKLKIDLKIEIKYVVMLRSVIRSKAKAKSDHLPLPSWTN